MTDAEFNKLYPKYESVIRAIARKIAQKNDSLIDDLVQEGCIALWKMNLKNAKDNVDAYIRQAIKFRMIDWMRHERPKQYESLQVYLQRGDQIVMDEDTGLPRLTDPVVHNPRDYDTPFERNSNNEMMLERATEDED